MSTIGEQWMEIQYYYFDPVNGDMKNAILSIQDIMARNGILRPCKRGKARSRRNIDGKWYYYK